MHLPTYQRWFARPPGVHSARSVLELPFSPRRLRMCLRFRLESHDLPVELGRHVRCLAICGTVASAPQVQLVMRGTLCLSARRCSTCGSNMLVAVGMRLRRVYTVRRRVYNTYTRVFEQSCLYFGVQDSYGMCIWPTGRSWQHFVMAVPAGHAAGTSAASPTGPDSPITIAVRNRTADLWAEYQTWRKVHQNGRAVWRSGVGGRDEFPQREGKGLDGSVKFRHKSCSARISCTNMSRAHIEHNCDQVCCCYSNGVNACGHDLHGPNPPLESKE